MEYVEGVDLRVYAEKLRLRPPAERAAEVRRIGAAICRALEAVHTAGLIHRDVKPSNVLLGERGRVVLADFGVVKDLEAGEETRAGVLIGTTGYAAPEQLSGRAVDARADLYGLGCTLFYLATGRRPYPAADRTALIRAHLSAPVPRARSVDPSLPSDLDATLSRLLAKDPARRFPDARSARRALDRGEAPTAAPLAGRRRYVDQLRAALEGARGGCARLIRVRGPEGSGRRWLLNIAEDLIRRGGLSGVVVRDEADLAAAIARLEAGELLAVVAREGPSGGALSQVPTTCITLEPLGMADIRRTVVSVAADTPSPSLVAEALHRASAGHPAWLEPLLRACRRGAVLDVPASLPVPPALERAVASLGSEDIEVLAALSVLGGPAAIERIERVAQLPAAGVLDGLRERGLVRALRHLWMPMGELVARVALAAAPDPGALRARAAAAERAAAELPPEQRDPRALSLRGKLAEARELATDEVLLAQGHGDRVREAAASLALGAALLDAGAFVPADAALADAVATARAVRAHAIRRAAHVLRAQVSLEAHPGSPAAASSALNRLSRVIRRVPGEDPEGWRVLAMAVRARACATLGDRAAWLEATARADDALALAGERLQRQAELELARAALLAGDRDAACGRAAALALRAGPELALIGWLAARTRAAACGGDDPDPPGWLEGLGDAARERLLARPVG